MLTQALVPAMLSLLLASHRPALPPAPVPAEREMGEAEILRQTSVPHPYAEQLGKLVLSTMGEGTLWGKFRDPEDGRRYVGADACRPCHYDRNRTWALTKMAAAIKKLADFKGGAFLNDSRCLSCHTTGYDPGRENGGFDEGVTSMASVQCEACHGAGSLMVEKRDRRYIIRTLDADLCGRCHTERYGTGTCFPEYDEWKESGHARSLQTLRGDKRASDSCLECHAADAVAPPSDRPLSVASASFGVTCQSCHDAMVRTFPELPDNNQLRKRKQELCQWCHSDRRPSSGRRPDEFAHTPQTEMFLGKGGAEFPGEKYQNGPMNADIERGCLTCHAYADRSIANPYQGHTFLPNILVCRRCHPDLSTFDRKGVQSTIRGLLLDLRRRLKEVPKEARGGDNYALAERNYYFVLRDRSLGIHNSDYARKLLTDSIRFLKKDL
jgi:hypothetical protein